VKASSPTRVRRLLFRAALVLWTLMLIEAASAAYFLFVARAYYRPLYLAPRNDHWLWRTERDDWGAWHRPSSLAHHTDSCFAATYRSNSYGARDRERSVTATAPRALFLGDSFIEGYGVDDDKRMTALLEHGLGFEMLNFGSAEFGPLQYAILYERLARRFDHDVVVVGVLPANDFVDNDLASARGWMAYRPYYAADGGVTYVRSRPGADEPILLSGRAVDLPEQRGLLRNVARLFWLYGVYREARYRLILLTDPGPSSYVGYFETDRTRIANVTRSLLEIGRSAAPRPVLVVFVPDCRDLRYVEMHPGSADTSVAARMRPELEKNGIKTIDLVKEFTRRGLDTDASYRRLYLPCDGHWNEAGHRSAAEVLQPVVGDLLRSSPRRR
jgi:hypothetical protein